MRKISPPQGFDPRTAQPVASRYTVYATRPTFVVYLLSNVVISLFRIFLFSLLTDYRIASIAAPTEGSVRLDDLSTAAVGRCGRSWALNLSRVRADSRTEVFGSLGSGCYQTQDQRQQQFNLKHEILVSKVFILIQRSGYQVHNQDFSLGDVNDLILRLCKIYV